MNNAKKKSNGHNPVTLFFEVAKGVFHEMENRDASGWNYMLDSEFPELMSIAQVTVPSPYPALMCAPHFAIKDKQIFEELLKRNKGTQKEYLLKEVVLKNAPTIIVYEKELSNKFSEWQQEGMDTSSIMIMTVYFFLHEMYHIIGLGEKDASAKASNAIYKIFSELVSIPEHEIDRWDLEKKLNKKA